ncbi:PaaI family thioesterase [Acinetobacter baumannii]
MVTIDLNTKMLRPLQVGKQYRSIGKLVNRGKEIIITEGYICDEEGKLYAHGSVCIKEVKY